MKNQMWAAIHEIFEYLNKIRSENQNFIPTGTDTKVLERGIISNDTLHVRKQIRSKLDILKGKLKEYLTERELYLVLFPIVVYIDEMVQLKIADVENLNWPSLQRELYQTDEGGDLFYETIDDILRKPATIPFIYEVYFFCLNDGFQGKYVGNLFMIGEYIKKLHDKIPLPVVEDQEKPAEIPNLIRRGRFPLWSYAATLSILALCYLILYYIALV